MTRTIFIAAALALAVTLPAAPAQATGVSRTFLSAAGSDSNNCANVLTPCRHLATAYAATAPNGEIYVLDPANYGSVTITHGVSIEGHGWASIAPVSGQAAITIIASPGDKINIIGVVLDGAALTATTGIQYFNGSSLIVSDSVIRNFSNAGINFAPNNSNSNQLYVSNTLVSDNGGDGIIIEPSGGGIATGVLDHVKSINNGNNGIEALVSTRFINITVSDSVSANNGVDGVVLSASNGGDGSIMVRNSTIVNNLVGLEADGIGASVLVTRSTITGNTAGWNTGTGGAVVSYGDNNIDNNGSFNSEPPSPLVYH